MDEPISALEFETMLLARHGYLSTSRTRIPEGRLDRSAYVVLSRIELDGPMSIGQLSDAFRLDASTVNRQTTAMMRAGLLQRIPDPDGGIARKFRITEQGRRRLHSDRETNVNGLSQILRDWTAAEISDFVEVLARFNRDIERAEGAAWPRPLPATPAGKRAGDES
ncbi:MarR family winged helix-turn-helix transcriptional regulator [Nakamurella lactea]|uniref:MarR family winged helix-turn-helix transcriptional regulator n=1 Tax=Nakamurella lactea TaxID=459515 RepID=UPI00056667C6|nr:MarR family transcriptional regulator [Nakamurella lactea]